MNEEVGDNWFNPKNGAHPFLGGEVAHLISQMGDAKIGLIPHLAY